ncbi:MAG: DegV family protein, partial [Dehalococcoidia bacterium]
LIQRHGIITVPLSFLFDGQLYYDGTISNHDFYDRLRASRHLPTTASPAPGRFLEAFRQAQQAGASAALCLTLSANYSGTFGSAVAAVDLATQELPGFPVRALDTRGLAMAHGFTVLAAARAAEAGADLDEVVITAEAVRDRSHLVGAIDTMRYLAKGGRVPWIAHWASALLQIKPILAANADKVTAVGRARTLGTAMERLVHYLDQRTRPGAPLHVAVMHTDAPERAQELALHIRQRFSPAELIFTEFTSVMGVHIGPGFVGLAFYSETNEAAAVAGGAADTTPARTREDDVRTLEASIYPLSPPRPTGSPWPAWPRKIAQGYSWK